MNLKSLKDKRVLILGLGREGESTFRLLRRIFPQKTLTLADQNNLEKLNADFRKTLEQDSKVILSVGKHYLEAIKDCDVIFKTPGIPEKIISPYLDDKIFVISEIEIFLEQRKNDCIGITGTKGKSTTSSLIHHILKNNNIDSKLVGNIGKPVFDYLYSNKKNKFVIELSSHQLNRAETSPHIAVFLNIFREHLDYYNNFKEYFEAKKNITKWQTKNDYFVFNSDSQLIKDVSKKSKAKLVSFGFNGRPKVSFKNNWILFDGEKIIEQKDIPLHGNHNILNTMGAIAVAKILKIPNKKIVSAIKTFKPLKHRMELFVSYKGVDFYNDSIATIPESTIQMIHSIPNIKTLILGGLNRGQNFISLAQEIVKRGIENIILIPENDKKIAQTIATIKGRKPKIFFAKNIKEVAKIAFENTKDGACILSPASASYNLFKNFEDRGDRFKKNIKELIRNEQKDKKRKA